MKLRIESEQKHKEDKMPPEDIKTFFYSIYNEKRVWGTPEMLDEFYAAVAPEFIFHRPPFPGCSRDRGQPEKR